MNIVEIPITSAAAHFVQENTIFGKAFQLEFEWIESRGFWMLHIADDTQPLALGLMLQPDWPIYTYHDATRPFTFMLLARSPGQVLGRQSLGQHFALVACEAL